VSDQLIHKGDHVLVLEETNNIADLSIILRSFADMSEDPDTDWQSALPNLVGLDFVAVTLYTSFVSPSNLDGYSLVGLQPIPRHPELQRINAPIYLTLQDEELGHILLLATRNDNYMEKEKSLKETSDTFIHSRVRQLRNL